MTDPKQQPKAGDPKATGKATKAEEKKVFVRNNSKTPYVIPGLGGANITLRPKRVTPVDADAWATFKDTPFGQSLAEAEEIEESNEDEHANQPESEQEKAAETDAAEEEAQRSRTSKKARK
jgi:RPA family protein